MATGNAGINSWNMVQEIALIEFWEDKRYMYDAKHPNYYRRDLRNSTLTAAATALGVDANGKAFTDESVKRKIKHMRENLLREIKKIEASIKSGDDPTYSPKWAHFNRLQFLRGTLYPVKGASKRPVDNPGDESTDTYVHVIEADCAVNGIEDLMSFSAPISDPQTTEEETETQLNKTPAKTRRQSTKKAQKNETPSCDDETCPQVQAMPEIKREYSAEDVFGMFVAATLKKLSNDKQIQVKFKIHKLLFEYETAES